MSSVIFNLLKSSLNRFVIMVLFLLRVIFWSDGFKQAQHDVSRQGFSRLDDVNDEGIKISIQNYVIWNLSHYTQNFRGVIFSIVVGIVTICTIFIGGKLLPSINYNFDGNWINLFSQIILDFAPVLGLVHLFYSVYKYCKNYYNISINLNEKYGIENISYEQKFDGNLIHSDEYVPIKETERFLNVSHRSSAAIWDEEFAKKVSNIRYLPFKINKKSYLPFYSKIINTRGIINRFNRKSYNRDFHLFNLYFRYRKAADRIEPKRGHPQSFTNDPKIRIDSIGLDEEKIELNIQVSPTDYYTSQITNVICGTVEKTQKERETTEESMRSAIPASQIDQDGYILDEFKNIHHMSNHVGGMHFSISLDGYPLVGLQNKRAAVGASSIVFCGAGSADWHDIHLGRKFGRKFDAASNKNLDRKRHNGFDLLLKPKFKKDNFLQVLRHAHAREVLEETGCVMQDSVQSFDQLEIAKFAHSQIKILGFHRNVNWGGLPIFFGVSQHYITYEQFVKNMRKGSEIYDRLELDIIDYRLHLSEVGSEVKPITNAANVIKFIDETIPRFVEVMNNKIVSPDDKRQNIDMKLNDQIYLVRNILKQSKTARDTFDRFFIKS